MGDETTAAPFPRHCEFAVPSNDMAVDMNEVKKSLEDVSKNNNNNCVDVEHGIVINDIGTLKGSLQEKDLTITVDDDTLSYDVIDSHRKAAQSPSLISVASPQPPTSIYMVGGSVKRPILELKDREVSTRQCKFEIGEEWEQFQIIHDKSISCPPSPLIGRKHDVVENGSNINAGYAASEPGAEIDQDLTGSSDKTKDPFPFHFLFNSASAAPLKECHIIPNPFNKLNQRFHSTLQCPCFLFFFFLCCLPAVHLMQQSDRQFKLGNNKRARNYGNVSTVCYFIGSVIGVTFLSVAIYFAADYVKQFGGS